MSLLYKRQSFQPSCPSGGNWYACGSGSFFAGCCRSDPCENDCPAGNLEPASFNTAFYGKFPDASCGTGSTFYTCNGSSPPFMGCCKSDPCKTGCPDGDLTGALLNKPNLLSAYSASGVAASTSTATSTSSQSSASTTAAASGSKPIAAIAAGAAGGAVGIFLLIGLLIYYVRRTSSSRKESQHSMTYCLSGLIGGLAKKSDVGPYGYDTAPPSYSSPKPTYSYSSVPIQSPDPHEEINRHSVNHYELPADASALSPTRPTAHKPLLSQRRHLSELSGETAIRSELESPQHSPNPQTLLSPRSSMLNEQQQRTNQAQEEQPSGSEVIGILPEETLRQL